VKAAGVGNRVGGFLPGFLLRQRPYGLQGGSGGKPRHMIGRSSPTLLAIGEARCTPAWLAFGCRVWRALHASMMPRFAMVRKPRAMVVRIGQQGRVKRSHVCSRSDGAIQSVCG
jgi:hypothetical protein